MRTLTVPAAVLFLSLITLACQDTPQPLDLDSAAPRAQLMSTVHGTIADDGQNHVGEVVVITDRTPTTKQFCGFTLNERNSVITNPGGGATITEIAIDPSKPPQPGDRFEITAQTECFSQAPGDRLDLTLEPITPEP